MEQTELAFAGIARQAELIRIGEVSSAQLVDLYLNRIARLNPRLNAFTVVLAESAREAAVEADERVEAGEEAPLLGVPVALKDETDVAGHITSHGTAAYDEPAAADAELWRRLRAAGAVLIGKTTLPELAILPFTETEAWGETRNPWDTDRSPGGSSGGSAAAVAAGLVGAASASDGGGSIRIPAAHCGLLGLKPQRGRVSVAPLSEHWLGLTQLGCVARRVVDAALWLDVVSGPAPGDADSPPPPDRSYADAAASEPGGLRVAVALTAPKLLAPPALLDPEVERAVERIADTLARLGHSIEEREPEWGRVGPAFSTRFFKGIEIDYDEVPNPRRLEQRTRGFKRIASLIPDALARRSVEKEAGHAARINEVFEHADVLLMPTVGRPPLPVGRWAGAGMPRLLAGISRVYPYTGVWNYTGQPAAAVPAGASARGLPLSVQLVAPPNREDLLLSLAAQLERELGWPDHLPPLAR